MKFRTAFLATLLTTCGLLRAGAGAVASVDAGGSPFDKGTWTMSLAGSYTTPIRFSEDELASVSVGVGYYFLDNNQINLELEGYFTDDREYLDGGDNEVYIGGIALLGRWHFIARETWSLFLDGGGSVTLASEAFPAEGTHFNLIGRVGLGASLRLSERTHLMGGARYWHLSNGQIRKSDDNPSYDGIQFWAGLMWTR